MVAAHTEKTYGKKICIDCATKIKNEKVAENDVN